VAEWSLLTNHAWVLLSISHDPGLRLRDIAARVGITERTAFGIVTDLTEAGYVVKAKDGRRNRYQIQANLPLRRPLPGPDSRGLAAAGEVLALLAGVGDGAAGLSAPDEGPAIPLADGGQTGAGHG
jgi:DNA-binding IclR family transcriptional regulator